MGRVAQSHIDYLKGLKNISIAKDARGFFNVFDNGTQQTSVGSKFSESDVISRVFGQDFYNQLSSGSLDSLAVEGFLSGSFNEEGIFGISMDLGSATREGGGSLETGSTEIGSGSPSAATPTGTTTNNTTTTGATSAGTTATGTGTSSGGTSGTIGSGTGSSLDQRLQTQAQLFGQQAYNAQQQKNTMLDSLSSNNPGNQIDLASLISSITGNQGTFGSDSGLAANFERQKLLKRQGRGTASTKVKDKIQTQAILSQPTLLGDDS